VVIELASWSNQVVRIPAIEQGSRREPELIHIGTEISSIRSGGDDTRCDSGKYRDEN
jgi:hypothetical protein